MAGSAAEVPAVPDSRAPGIPEEGGPAEPKPEPADAPAPSVSSSPAPDSAPHQHLRDAIARPGQLRASDEERDQAAGELREHFAAGRLSHDTFLRRMNTAMDAQHQADLPPLFADLPGRRPRGWLSAGWAGSVVHRLLGALPDAQSGRARARPLPPPIRLPFPRGTATMFTIGRDRHCDLAIDDLTVSRQHARLHRTEEGYWLLTDLGSRNGTRVNGWRVRDPVEVRAGDLIRFGDAVYILGGED